MRLQVPSPINASPDTAGQSGRHPESVQPIVSWAHGSIRLRDARLLDRKRPAACRTFIRRVFRLKEVIAVEIDLHEREAAIRYDGTRLSGLEALGRLAAAIRGESLPDQVRTEEPPPWPPADRRHWKLFRHGSLLSSWEIASDLPGRVRFRHDELRTDHELAVRAEAEVATAHGVTDVRVRPLTGSLLVHFDPRTITPKHLLHILDRLLLGPEPAPQAGKHPPLVRFGLATTSVGLAALGTFALPVLLPASAILLIVSNRTVIRAAVRDIGRFHLSLPVLFTTIIAGTLLSGDFLTAAVMAWMLVFWRHRHRVAQFQLRRQLLPALVQRRRFARLCAGNAHVEVPVEQLREGDRILVEEGELIPADGCLIGGPAVIDERLVRGVSGLSLKQDGDRVLAGSLSVEGSVEIEIRSPAHAAHVALLGAS